MNDEYSKFTDFRQREFLLDYIEKSEAEFSEQTKIPEMKKFTDGHPEIKAVIITCIAIILIFTAISYLVCKC